MNVTKNSINQTRLTERWGISQRTVERWRSLGCTQANSTQPVKAGNVLELGVKNKRIMAADDDEYRALVLEGVV